MSLPELVRSAIRRHRRRPSFAAITVLAVGFAIGINVTVFAALDAVKTPELPIESPDRLLSPQIYPARPAPQLVEAFGRELLEGGGIPSFTATTKLTWDGGRVLAESDRGWRDGYVFNVADNFFAVLRPRLDAGRVFGPADRGSGTNVVVITSALEQALFRGAESAVGRQIKLAGEVVTVLGVIPRRAAYPEFADAYKLGVTQGLPGQYHAEMWLARARPGVVHSQIRNELGWLRDRIEPPPPPDRFNRRGESRVHIEPAFPVSQRLRDFHWAMLLAAVAVLLVACFNVGNLQMARGFQRADELSVRAALGATRRQLFGLLLVEMIVLAVAGALLGLLLGAGGVQLFGSSVAVLGARGLVEPQWSWRVFLGTGLAATASLTIAGVASAMTVSTLRFSTVLRSGAAAGVPRQERRASGVLMVSQIALALALCIHSALLTRTAVKLQTYDVGFETDHLVTGAVALRADRPGAGQTRTEYAATLLARLRALPNVTDAGVRLATGVPAAEAVTADPESEARQFPMSRWSYQVVMPSWFRTLGVRVTRGRDFNEAGESAPVAIISERAAQQWWPGRDPVDRMLKLGRADVDAPWVRVVGVVPDLRLTVSLDEEPPPLVVVSHAFDTTHVARKIGIFAPTFIARTRGNASNLMTEVMRLSEGDEGPGRRTWANTWNAARNLDAIRARERFVATIFWIFTVLAIVLAALGVYSLTTYTVSRRRTELGVRLALGATPRALILDALREGNLLGMLGIAGGLVLAGWSVELLSAFLLGLEPFEPALFGVVAAIMLLVVLSATLPSALRSGATNPVSALRNE